MTTALSLYLAEIEGDCRACVRHRTTAVIAGPHALCLTRLFPWSEAVAAHVREAAARLPGWQESPFWDADGRRWEAFGEEPVTSGHVARRILARGVAWEGRPILVRLDRRSGTGVLALDLLLATVSRDLPELPLCRVASGLRCQAQLLPDQKPAPLSFTEESRPGAVPVAEFLLRAMPENLFASQCLLLAVRSQ